MCLRFVFLLITRVAAWLRLSRREEASKTAEILILHHQLAVLRRQQPPRPKLNWADRALLTTLLSVIPKARRRGLRLLVTPGTILRWHRDIVRRRWAARSVPGKPGHPPEHQGPGSPASLREPRMGLPQDPRRAGRPGSKGSGIDGRGDPEECRDRPGAAPVRAYLVAVPALPGPGDPGVRLVYGRSAQQHPGEWTTQQARNLLMDLGGQADRVQPPRRASRPAVRLRAEL
jgi:hypothetical protein